MRKISLSNSCEYTGLAMLSCILVLAVTEGISFHARKIVSYCYLVSFPSNGSLTLSHLLGKTSAKDFFLTQFLQHSPPMLFIKILRKAQFIFGNQVYVKSCLCLKKRNYYWRSSFLCQNEETEEKESKND